MSTKFRYAPAIRTLSRDNDHRAGSRAQIPEYSEDEGLTWHELREAPQTVQETYNRALYRDEHWRFVAFHA